MNDNLYELIYGNLAWDMFMLSTTMAYYFAARYGDEFTRYRFNHNMDAYLLAYNDFCANYPKN